MSALHPPSFHFFHTLLTLYIQAKEREMKKKRDGGVVA
jgi:hypothetical protein